MDEPSIQNPNVPFEPERRHPLTNKLQFIKKNVLPAVLKHHVSWPFKNPVDVVGLKLYNYYNVVKSPMDLTTIYKRLIRGWYPNAAECVADFNLIIQNCLAYNNPDEDVSRMAEVLRRFFHEKLLKAPQEEFVVASGKRKEPDLGEPKSPGSTKKPPKRVKGQGLLQKKCFDTICELFDARYSDFMGPFYAWPEGASLAEVKQSVESMRYESFEEFVGEVESIISRISTMANQDLAPKLIRFKCLFHETLINIGIQYTNEEGLQRTFEALMDRLTRLEEELSSVRKVDKAAKQSSPYLQKSPPKTEGAPAEEEMYTYEEKRRLSSVVTTRLPTEELIKIIQMVKEEEPSSVVLSETGEFIFDFQQLRTSTIRRIEQHSNDYLRRAEKSLTSGKRRCSDRLNAEKIVERKLELERELDGVRNMLAPRRPREEPKDESSEGSPLDWESDGMDLG